MAITRDQAYQQYKGAYGSNFDADAEQDFVHNWANAGADSGGYQSGPQATKTWEQQMGDVRNRVNERFNQSTNDRIYDSQSAQGDALYGSGSQNANNIPGMAGKSPNTYGGGAGFGSGMNGGGNTSWQQGSGAGASGSGLAPGATGANAGKLIDMLMGRMTGQFGAQGGQGGGLYDKYKVNPAMDPFRQQLMSEMQGMIGANKGGVSYEDIQGNPETQAFRLASQRGYDRDRSRMAARGAAQGTNQGGNFSGGLDVEMGKLGQQQTEREGQFEAQLANRMTMDKKDRLEKALTMGAGFLSDQDRLSLQGQLQGVNAEIQQQQAALGLLGQLVGNTQFYDKLGYDLGGQEAGLNAQAMGQLF